VHACSGGIPRRINTICDLALLVGFGNNLQIIDKQTIIKINEDLESSDFDVKYMDSQSKPPSVADNIGKDPANMASHRPSTPAS
jgi:hypothetical protein